MPKKCDFNGNGDCPRSNQSKNDCEWLDNNFCWYPEERKLTGEESDE